MAKWNIDKLCRPKKYMGQIMAEWGCQHHACDARGYYMAKIPSPEAIVRAALERAAQTSRRYGSRHEPHGHPAMGDDEVKVLASCQMTKAIRALASNRDEINAILLKAAGKTNNG